MTVSLENRVFLKKMRSLMPAIVGQEVLNALVNILSTIMIGRAMGIHEITAVGIANQIFMSYSFIVAGVVGGCAVFIGQYHGKGDNNSIFKVMGIGYSALMAVTVLIFLFAQIFPQHLIGLFTQDLVVIELAIPFIRIASISYFLFAIIFLRNGAMRSMGKTKLPMITTGIALFISFSLHYLFIFTLQAPLYIVALAPVVARLVEAIAQQFLIKKHDIKISTTFKKYFDFDLPYVKNFFKISIYIVLHMIIRSVAVSGYMIAYGFMGTDAQGAVQVATATVQLLQIVAGSIGVTASIIMANTLGSGDIPLAIRYSRKCLTLGIISTAIMSGVFILVSPYIVAFYLLEPAVETYVHNILIISSIGMVVRTIVFVNLGGILRGGGDTRFCFVIVLLAVLIGLPLAFAGAVWWQLPVYWVVALVYSEEVFKAVFSLYRVFTNKWANRIV